ncbi:MAG TPA: twin-arginine translocase subunit TatB [Moraxellaceae bacterium]|nr:twin-arginine translocase subunit TatB [Moraxellaceae bacterium]
MFDVGFSELILMAIVALVVLGPEKLPHAARVAGAWIGRIKRMVGNMQAEIEREVSAQEMRERLQKEIDAVRDAGEDLNIQQPFQEVATRLQDMENHIHSSLPPATAVGSSIATSIVTASKALPEDPAPDTSSLPPEAVAADPAAAVTPVVEDEAAYREWLAAQKNANLRPATSPDDSSPS